MKVRAHQKDLTRVFDRLWAGLKLRLLSPRSFVLPITATNVTPKSESAATMTGFSSRKLMLLAIAVTQTYHVTEAFAIISRMNVQLDRSSTELSATRRFVLDATIGSSTAALLLLQNPSPAVAGYGDSADIKGFDYIEYLLQKNKVADPSTFLYQGADREVQLKRMSDAVTSLKQIPDIARAKKWSQVQGILTGPLGTLVQTMTQIVSGTDPTRTDFGGAPQPNKEAALQQVKADLYAIGEAAMKKSESKCIESTEVALKDLEAFVKVAF